MIARRRQGEQYYKDAMIAAMKEYDYCEPQLAQLRAHVSWLKMLINSCGRLIGVEVPDKYNWGYLRDSVSQQATQPKRRR